MQSQVYAPYLCLQLYKISSLQCHYDVSSRNHSVTQLDRAITGPRAACGKGACIPVFVYITISNGFHFQWNLAARLWWSGPHKLINILSRAVWWALYNKPRKHDHTLLFMYGWWSVSSSGKPWVGHHASSHFPVLLLLTPTLPTVHRARTCHAVLSDSPDSSWFSLCS